MKTLLATAALATLVTASSPVAAQSWRERVDRSAEDAYARALPSARRAPINRPLYVDRMRSNPAYDAYDSGNYVGTDPDPLIRLELMRDPPGNQ